MKTDYQRFLKAIENGDIQSVEILLKSKEVLDDIIQDGSEVLDIAAKNGSLVLFERLLQEKVILDALSSEDNGFQTLLEALRNGHSALAERLLQEKVVREGVLKDAVSDDDKDYFNRALCIAAEKGLLSIVKSLLALEPVKRNAHKALYWAAYGGDLPVLECLLEIEKVQTYVARDDENEVLRAAATNGHFPVMLRLLKEKSVRDNVAAHNNDAFCEVARHGDLIMLEHLLAEKTVKDNIAASSNRALFNAVQAGKLPVVERLLKEQAVLNQIAEDVKPSSPMNAEPSPYNANTTLLRAASENGHLAIVKRLLQIKELRDNVAANENIVLCVASEQGYLPVVERLLQEDLVKSTVADYNNAPLHAAAGRGQVDVMKRLLEEKTVRDNIAINDNWVFSWAADQGRLPAIEFLMREKAVRDNITAKHNKALRKAAINGHFAVVDYLLKEKAVNEGLSLIDKHRLLMEMLQPQHYTYGTLRTIERLLEERAVCRIISAKNHAISRFVLANGDLGLCYLILNTYKLNNIPIPSPNSFKTIHKNILHYQQENVGGEEIDSNALENFHENYQKGLTKLYEVTRAKLQPVDPLVFSFLYDEIPKAPPVVTSQMKSFSMSDIERIHAAFYDAWASDIMEDPILITDTFGDAVKRSKIYSKSSLSAALDHHKSSQKSVLDSIPDLKKAIAEHEQEYEKIQTELGNIDARLVFEDLDDNTSKELEEAAKQHHENLEHLQEVMHGLNTSLDLAITKSQEAVIIKDPLDPQLLLKDNIQNQQGQDAKILMSIAFAAAYKAIQDIPDIEKTANKEQHDTIKFYREYYAQDDQSHKKLADPKFIKEHAEIKKRQTKLKEDTALLEKFLANPQDPNLKLSKEQIDQLKRFRISSLQFTPNPPSPPDAATKPGL